MGRDLAQKEAGALGAHFTNDAPAFDRFFEDSAR